MPRVRMSTSVAGADFAWSRGEEVDMSPEDAQAAVNAGWGELVRDAPPVTPESRQRRPETSEGHLGAADRGDHPGRPTGRPRRR